MEVIGVIAEYNPFHNGHLYHINKIKELYPDSLIVAVISSHFCERGEISVLNKWDKTKICLENGIDLVIELPFVFSSQSADIFAYGALKILNYLGVKKLVFGSETNDIEKLKEIASLQINNNELDSLVKDYLDTGINYPTALSKALEHFSKHSIKTPNDLLGISYIKEIIKNNYNIEPISIKRTNDYHSKDYNSNIISATAIRNLIKENKDISSFVPKNVENLTYKNTDYYSLLKYKINSEINNLNIYQTVDEGIEGRIKKYINTSNTLDELVDKIKQKRYTYNKVNRMLIHILTSFTKNENNIDVTYIRILGFNNNGRKYLSKIKKDIEIPLITSYKNFNDDILNIEYRITCIYSIIVNDPNLISRELKSPIIL